MNDELHSSNEELRERTSEVDQLNQFMEAIFTSLRAGVTVVDRDLRVQVWNSRAEDLWGVRREEAIGEHLLNLDIGLPVEALRPGVRRLLADGAHGHEQVVLEAVNRRGRPVRVRVTATPLRGSGPAASVIIVMDELAAGETGNGQEPADGSSIRRIGSAGTGGRADDQA